MITQLFAVTALLFAAGLPQSSVEGRAAALERALLAPCCYSSPLSGHESEVARQMKAEIRAWIAAGKTDRDILDAYLQRYGERVLVEPEGAAWWWMHIVPWVFLAFGFCVVVLLLRRMLLPRRSFSAVTGAAGQK